jgi:hypothetical protein
MYGKELQEVSPRCTRQEGSKRSFISSPLDARLRLKLKKDWTGMTSSRQRYDTNSLWKDITKLQEFKITLPNRSLALQENDNSKVLGSK